MGDWSGSAEAGEDESESDGHGRGVKPAGRFNKSASESELCGDGVRRFNARQVAEALTVAMEKL